MAEEAQDEVAGDSSDELTWLQPGQRATPPEALRRIQALCAGRPDLFAAMFLVLATHQELPRDMLAAAIKQFRADLDAYSRDDVVSLLTAIWNGGKSGFDAVLRTRVNSPKKGAGGFSWVKE
ncbi:MULTISPECIES: hypothetical protein [unclassified Roseateles]|jgi:hypothetical protein|uniref:hypothetical protein n=1 Tax=unclassified Roseateles TaxID=2626991 RepID=UPI0006F2E930|nr:MULTISPECIES: hypothetical protein [unclassified Roseateles]KQW51522.1 hypothetical protein ASC81_02470 [Pelomonas sp. Root405]KRA77755.1 hypothetical protein ASD88_02470 [Pelomonas sp. Root662]